MKLAEHRLQTGMKYKKQLPAEQIEEIFTANILSEFFICLDVYQFYKYQTTIQDDPTTKEDFETHYRNAYCNLIEIAKACIKRTQEEDLDLKGYTKIITGWARRGIHTTTII